MIVKIDLTATVEFKARTNASVQFFVNSITDTFERVNVLEFNDGEEKLATSFTCRSIRIGSYKFDSTEKVKEKNFLDF